MVESVAFEVVVILIVVVVILVVVVVILVVVVVILVVVFAVEINDVVVAEIDFVMKTVVVAAQSNHS